mgnify:CR=1 FL=1
MLDAALALRTAWTDVLDQLDLSSITSLVMGGEAAEITADTFPLPVADSEDSLVTLGTDAPAIRDDATPTSTGLEGTSVDAFAFLEGAAHPGELDAVVSEARRIVRPGGVVVLGELDREAVLTGTASTRRSAAFHRTVGLDMPSRPGAVAPTATALVRGRISNVESTKRLLPLAAFSDAEAYVSAAFGGMWFGVERLSVADRASLERSLLRDLRSEVFPLVEFRPWIISRGIRP